MSVDDIIVEIHHGRKFVDGGVSEIEPVDIDGLSRFEIIRLAKDIGFTNVEEFYYLIPRMSLREGLRTCHNDFESLDIAAAAAAAVHKRLVVYLVHRVDVPKEVVPEMSTLPCPSMATQQSNVDPISSNINDAQTPTPTPTPTPTSTSAAIPIPSPTSTTRKPQSHDTTPVFNVNNEHGGSLNEESGDSEYVPETEHFKARGKRKINVGGGADDDGCENDGDEHDLDTDIQDEWETNVEDLEISDEEWATAKAKVGECKKQKGLGRTDNAEQVGKQDMAADKPATGGIEQTHLGSKFHSDYKISAEMDIDGETNEDVLRLLRKKEKSIKVDKHTNFKKLKWQAGMTFGTVQGFKDAISSFAIAQVSRGSREQQLPEVKKELEAGELEGEQLGYSILIWTTFHDRPRPASHFQSSISSYQ
ncbi:hypothetical protein Cgig2_015255 [Carnegiea gigantea]|uniref:PB1-like domain-containing protein n=1 Tax=Carnegiea gigantea TaxID=171969 RepID=A0A9Q1KLA9_9CARY|nr:hypothetical protein Cgig2_015255 [Carnegiea gigantea]